MTSNLVNLDGLCAFETTMTSKNACPVYSLNALWAWLQDYYWLWGVVMIISGIFLAFLGQKLFSVTLFFIGMVVTIALVWVIFYSTFLTDSTEDWVAWVVLGCSTVLGLFGGFLLYKLQRLGATVIGGWGGFLLGVVFNTTVLWSLSSTVIFWVVSLSFALLSAMLAFCFYYHAVILATAFVGSYFFVRGISLYVGGFPNEWALMEQIKSGAISHIDYWFYLYLTFILLLFLFSTWVQYCSFRKDRAEGKIDARGHPKHPYDNNNEEEGRCCCCC